SESEFAALCARIAQVPVSEAAGCIVSLHKPFLGCNAADPIRIHEISLSLEPHSLIKLLRASQIRSEAIRSETSTGCPAIMPPDVRFAGMTCLVQVLVLRKPIAAFFYG